MAENACSPSPRWKLCGNSDDALVLRHAGNEKNAHLGFNIHAVVLAVETLTDECAATVEPAETLGGVVEHERLHSLDGAELSVGNEGYVERIEVVNGDGLQALEGAVIYIYGRLAVASNDGATYKTLDSSLELVVGKIAGGGLCACIGSGLGEHGVTDALENSGVGEKVIEELLAHFDVEGGMTESLLCLHLVLHILDGVGCTTLIGNGVRGGSPPACIVFKGGLVFNTEVKGDTLNATGVVLCADGKLTVGDNLHTLVSESVAVAA